MQCKCGYDFPANLATTPGFQGHCPSCNKKLSHTTEELLSRAELGVVKEVRPGQIELAKTIEAAINNIQRQVVFAEGPCGSGKSLAYGIPALLSNKRFIISTAKKGLQDQLSKDIPRLVEQLSLPHTVVTLKGKGNFLCRRMLRKNKALFEKMGKGAVWSKLEDWIKDDPHGDLNAFGDDEFPISTCTAEECVGKSCRFKDTCGYMVTKSRVRDAHVVIANHSLVGYDLRLGVGRIFGDYSLLIVDESHAFAEYARKSFSEDVSDAWMRNFLGRLARENLDIKENPKTIEAEWERLFKEIPEQKLLEPGFWPKASLDKCIEHIDGLDEDFFRKFTALASKRVADTNDLTKLMADETFWSTLGDDEAEDLSVLTRLHDKMHEKRQLLRDTQSPSSNVINCREETANGHVKLVRQPVELGPLLKTPLSLLHTVVFTSATLNFDLTKSELGVEPHVEISVTSPFNFRQHGLMYLPKHLPRPGEPGFIKAVGDEVVQLVRLSRGNALVLFTSIQELREVHEYMFANYDLEYPVLAQLPGRKAAELFSSFMATENSILMGSKSFFEGIDVPGDKLRLVIIVKIPFPQQEDPLSKAKERVLGKNLFWTKYYFPKMALDIQQAAGRLIRTATDKGVVAILDTRIWTAGRKDLDPKTVGTGKVPWQGYGFKIFKMLPFEQFTPNLARVKDFFDLILKRNPV